MSKFSILFLFVSLIRNESMSSKSRLDKIRIKGKWFVDEQERVVLFHGINSVRKEPSWLPDTNLQTNLTNQTQIDYLKMWGFNVVRLGLMWSGLMPSKDFINYTYLGEMIRIVDNLEKAGIYVIIDLHQDMLSSKLYFILLN